MQNIYSLYLVQQPNIQIVHNALPINHYCLPVNFDNHLQQIYIPSDLINFGDSFNSTFQRILSSSNFNINMPNQGVTFLNQDFINQLIPVAIHDCHSPISGYPLQSNRISNLLEFNVNPSNKRNFNKYVKPHINTKMHISLENDDLDFGPNKNERYSKENSLLLISQNNVNNNFLTNLSCKISQGYTSAYLPENNLTNSKKSYVNKNILYSKYFNKRNNNHSRSNSLSKICELINKQTSEIAKNKSKPKYLYSLANESLNPFNRKSKKDHGNIHKMRNNIRDESANSHSSMQMSNNIKNMQFLDHMQGWKRIKHEGKIFYISPTNIELSSIDDVEKYLLTPGTCKCGLQCPVIIDKIFDFVNE
ncbi:unnamed protein product [Gordionus sp. m RMFG-2023]